MSGNQLNSLVTNVTGMKTTICVDGAIAASALDRPPRTWSDGVQEPQMTVRRHGNRELAINGHAPRLPLSGTSSNVARKCIYGCLSPLPGVKRRNKDLISQPGCVAEREPPQCR